MNIFLSKIDTIERFVDVDFIYKTKLQIQKDFGSSGVSFPTRFMEIDLPFDEMVIEIQVQLVEIMKHGETQLLQLLYQIDIPQQHFLEFIGNADFTGELAQLIIRREAYKVYLRSKF